MKLSRRSFMVHSAALAGAASAVAAPRDTEYHPPNANTYDFLLPRVSASLPDWDFLPGGDRNLLERLGEEFGMRVLLAPGVKDRDPENGMPAQFNAVVNLGAPDSLQRYPVLFMMGTGSWNLNGERRGNLKQYIESGGFVLMDECAAPWLDDEFYASSLRCLYAMFGNDAVRQVPEDHAIYSNVYDIASQNFQSWKRPNGVNPDMGVFVGDRLAVYLNNADLHCGWSDPKDELKRRTYYEEGIQRGINLFEYFLSYGKNVEV